MSLLRRKKIIVQNFSRKKKIISNLSKLKMAYDFGSNLEKYTKYHIFYLVLREIQVNVLMNIMILSFI